MGIFRDITKSLKKAAPIIGAGIGMYYGGAFGASLGSGIGSLASGRSTEESLRNAALAGGAAYLAGGAGTVGGGAENFNVSNSPLNSLFSASSEPITQVASNSSSGGIGEMIKSAMPTSTLGKAALFGGAGALLGGLGGEENQLTSNQPAYPTGKTRLGYGRIGDKQYNLDDEKERAEYYKDNRERSTGTVYSAAGGEVNGPGTGTSDSVPARLSDGEFVLTAKAMRGAGGGDRDVGAARMYDMMSQLEGAA